MIYELDPGDTYYVLGASLGKGGTMLKNWFFEYHRKRIQRKIKIEFLSDPELVSHLKEESTRGGDPDMNLVKIKSLLPAMKTPMQINLYKGNKVLMFIWEEKFVCFEIESEPVYQNFKAYFDALSTISKQETN